MAVVNLNARFSPRVLIPSPAVPPSGGTLTVKTSDGVTCVARFLSVWDNSDGRYDGELDALCRRQWGCGFDLVRTMWDGRLGRTGDVWHYVELKKI